MADIKYYLYKIINRINNKIYIGITNDPYKRWYGHRSKTSKCLKLKYAMEKHGRDNFKMEILATGGFEEISFLEVGLIDRLNLINQGYNIMPGGLGISKEDKPARPVWDNWIFVSGWWFPDVSTALKSLKWSKHKFWRKKQQSLLSEVKHKDTSCPVYYKGFWFPSYKLPCKFFKKEKRIVLSYHYKNRNRQNRGY